MQGQAVWNAQKAREDIRTEGSEVLRYVLDYNDQIRLEIAAFFLSYFLHTHHTIHTPQPHPSAGEYVFRPLGGGFKWSYSS